MTAEAEIRRRIRERGPITFAEFMEAALYWPGGGYYSGGDSHTGDETSPFGPTGDYYTSPMAHPAFGALLAVQLYQFWLLLDRPSPFPVVEAGSGNGQLCHDILAAAEALPEPFPASVRYLCVDPHPSGPPQDLPRATRLAARGIPLRNLRGCIISNELLDAFPVHQVRVEQGRLQEVFVALEYDDGGEGNRLVERLGDPSTPALAARLEERGVTLAEGQTAEINLALDDWAREAAAALDSGFVLTIDYGRTAEELYSADLRPRGTLTTYYRHTQTDSPLRHIGQQDITAQVDFTSVIEAGRLYGLELLGLTTQARFLHNLDLPRLRRRVTSTPMPVEQAVANRAGLVALGRPGGLGDFKVLVQGKNLPSHPGEGLNLWGLAPSPEVRGLVESLPLPLLSAGHISLPQGWPQSANQEFEITDLLAGPFGDT